MPPKPSPIFYDTLRQLYWTQNNREGWIQINESSVKRNLKLSGLTAHAGGEADKEISRIQTENDVDYAGPLAGYSSGMVEQCGYRVLVTSSPKFIVPAPGKCEVILKLVDNILGSQSPHFFGWLKIADEAMRSGNFRPGQAFVIVGPAGSGKSLLQNLITPFLGGRSAKPYLYMSGGTSFNGDLFTAEHLMIEDEVSSSNPIKRHHFGTQIKSITVNETQPCHPKSKQTKTLIPFWRLSITTNEDNITILPVMVDDLADKFILTKASKLPMPMPTNTNDERKAFMTALLAEMPAFVHFIQQWEIPEKLKCSRFGIASYQNPELMDELNEMAPETKLLNIIDSKVFGKDSLYDGGWKGSAEKLENLLRTSEYGSEVGQILNWQNAIGVYLGRLAAKYPHRVSQRRDGVKRTWTLKPLK